MLEGARDNLPDQAALLAAQRIQAMISQTMCADDVLLVLISGNVVYTENCRELIGFFLRVRHCSLSAEHWTWIVCVVVETSLMNFAVVQVSQETLVVR